MAQTPDTSGHVRALPVDEEPAARLRHHLWRPVILTAGAAVYWALYSMPWIFPGESIVHVTFVFAALAGYFFGFVSGTTASAAGIFLHAIVLKQTGHDSLVSMWLAAPTAHVGVAIAGPFLGRLRRAERRAREESRKRRAFEARLRTSEAQYRMIVERMTEGVIQCANDDTVLYANQQFCEMTGYSAGELAGQTAASLLAGPDDGRGADRGDDRAGEQLTARRVPLRRADGDTTWCQLNKAPIHDADGNTIGWVGTFTDVSAQVRTEDRLERERRALQESETRFRELVDNLDVIFWVKSTESRRLVYISPAFETVFGRPRMTVYADQSAILEFVHPEDRDRVARALETPATSEYELEYRIVRPDGEIRWIHSRAFPVHDRDRTTRRVAGITSDVTSRRHAEALTAARGTVMGALGRGRDLGEVLSAAREAAENALPGAAVVILGPPGGDHLPVTGGIVSPEIPAAIVGNEDSPGIEAIARSARGRIVIEDVGADPRLAAWKDTFASAGIRACWIEPVHENQSENSGALVVFFRLGRSPGRSESCVLETIANLLRIAIARHRTHERLRSQEELLRLFVEHSPAAIAMFDTDARYVAASRRWLDDFGIDTDAIAGKARDAVKPDTPAHWRRVHTACLSDHVSRRGEDLVERKPGVADWIRWEVRPWFHPGGSVGGVTMWTELVTGQRQAREQLERSEARYRFLVDHLPDVLTEIDVTGNVLFATRDFPGRPRREVVGTSIFEHVEADARALLRAALDEASRSRAPRDVTAVFKGAGSENAWEHRLVPIVDNGIVVKFLVISTDVSARLRAENALLQSEKRYRRHFENDVSAAFIEAPDGTLLACNDAFAGLLGFASTADALAVKTSSLFPRPEVREEITREIAERGQIRQKEVELRTREGRPVHVIANAIGEFSPDGELERIYGYLIDDTARRRLENQLHQSQKMEAIGRLAGGIAHDFNNMLTTISGYAEMLQGRTDDGSQPRRYADEILQASDRASDLTRRLLEFSRKEVLEPRAVDVNSAINAMEAVLERTIGENIALEVSTDTDVGRILAAPGMIENVLLNLSLNARDAMPDGGRLCIRTDVEHIAGGEESGLPLPAGPYAVITVSDTGVGMDDVTQAKIFEPFFTTKEQGRGTGLGLATVYGAVHQCGGHVRVVSRPGEGATFRLYFAMTDQSAPRTGRRDVILGPSTGTETVMVAEDETAVQRLTRDVLESRGYRVLVADDGEEALREARAFEGTIDLLVTDLVMPRLNGRELAARMREIYPEVKVLYISGYIGRAGVRVAELGPRTSFLSKPFSPQSFSRKVRLLLDVDRRRRPTLADITRRRARESIR